MNEHSVGPHATLRSLPAVQALLEEPRVAALSQQHGHRVVTDAAREAIDELRRGLLCGEGVGKDGNLATLAEDVMARVLLGRRPKIRRTVNATGIILHTNLGRAVLPAAARAALLEVAGYCNVETDLETGKRTQREHSIDALVRQVTGGEDVLVVNNNAGATLLALRALAAGKEVLVSRGELIEIGGSFRLPDVMAESGAIMREVGSTNKTRLSDYEQAIGPQTGLIFKANRSNFDIVGFTEEVGIAELAALAQRHHIPLVHDLGCGALIDLASFGLVPELTVQQSLALGADLVLFSTDKLMGGPQGGLIVGGRAWVERLRGHALYRALRVCKLTVAALEATLRLFQAPEHLTRDHATYAVIAKPIDEIQRQAHRLVSELMTTHGNWEISVSPESSRLGGGSSPASVLPSFVVKLWAPELSAEALAAKLRAAEVPIFSRIQADHVLLDMRTVLDSEVPDIVRALAP